MEFLSRLFGPPRVEPAPEGEAVGPDRFGRFAFAFLHDQLFLGGDDSWVSELEASAGLSLDDLLVAFRIEYVIFMLGAVRHTVRETVGEETAEHVAASAASAAIDAFSEQLGAKAEQVDWGEVRALVEDQSRQYAEISGSPQDDGDARPGRIAFERLAPDADPNPDAGQCLEEQYRRMSRSVRDMIERNPLARPGE